MNKYTTNEKEEAAVLVKLGLDEVAKAGAQRMLSAALDAEVDDYLSYLQNLHDEKGHALAVRNGRAQERTLTLKVGPIQVKAPRVHDRRPGHTFSSSILPPYLRRSPQLETALPILYLKGLSSGDFQEAMAALFGQASPNFSASTVTRLLKTFQDEYQAWRKRPLQGKDYAYIWADGVFGVRLEEDRLACLVLVGVLPDGSKEVIALEDGYRESKESWASLLRDLQERGMEAPILAIGDGAMGFWAALAEVFPKTREQRCWVHKMVNVLDHLPKRLQPKAKEMLHEIVLSPDRESAKEEIGRFTREFRAAYPKATDCTGCICAPPTPSNPASLRSRRALARPKVPARGGPAWPWPTS
jgi:putative transposase